MVLMNWTDSSRPESWKTLRTLTTNNICRSLEFNLKSRVFCELFPELKLECQSELDRRKSLESVGNPDSQVIMQYNYFSIKYCIKMLESNIIRKWFQSDRRPLDSQAANYGVFGNVLVIGGFAAFAFVVRYVLQSMAALE